MPMPVSANYPKFTNEELYRFINEYEKHRMLYDFDHPLYTNYVERLRRFSAISRALNIDGLTAERVRAKIKVFRGNYTHRLKEFYKKQKTGEPFNAPHWWYMADKFLRSHIRFLDPDVVEGQHPTQTNPNHFTIQPTQNASASEAEIYFGSDMPVSSTVEVVEEEQSTYAKEDPQSQMVKPVNVKTEVVVESRLGDNSIYLELDDEQLMAIENGEMSIEDVTARAEAAASQHQQQQQAARDRSMKAERMNSRETARNEEEEERSRTNEEEETEDEFDAFGRCVALQLKTLPIDAALELESQIHTLITKKRMVLLRKNKLH